MIPPAALERLRQNLAWNYCPKCRGKFFPHGLPGIDQCACGISAAEKARRIAASNRYFFGPGNFKCHRCGKKSQAEHDHITHRCRRLHAWLRKQWRRLF